MRSLVLRHWFLILITLAVAAALTVPHLLKPFTDWFEPRRTIAFSLFLMAWTMPTRSLVDEVRRPFASAWAVLISYGLLPLSAWALGYLAPDANVQIGLILIACVPCTLSAAILWTRMAGGNEATALLTVLGTTFLSWCLTTAWLAALTGTSVTLDIPSMMRDLVLSLILPVIIGQALRRIPPCKAFAERYKVLLGICAQLFVVVMILKAGVTAGDKLHSTDNGQAGNVTAIFVSSLFLANGLHLWAMAASWWTCRWLGFDRGRQIAVAFSASQKTLQVSIVLFEQYFARDFPFAVVPLLFYHVGQLLLDTAIAKQITKGAPAKEPEEMVASD